MATQDDLACAHTESGLAALVDLINKTTSLGIYAYVSVLMVYVMSRPNSYEYVLVVALLLFVWIAVDIYRPAIVSTLRPLGLNAPWMSVVEKVNGAAGLLLSIFLVQYGVGSISSMNGTTFAETITTAIAIGVVLFATLEFMKRLDETPPLPDRVQ
jgi:hypothetical protein